MIDKKLGVVVGRFQVERLTYAHRMIIKTVAEKSDKVLILIGVSPVTGVRRNPLDYETRLKMLRNCDSEYIIKPLYDMPSDTYWSKSLDKVIEALDFKEVCLYGGRDSFFDRYNGKFDTETIVLNLPDSGTEQREKTKRIFPDSSIFRAGVIYNTYNQYPRVIPTVDIAILSYTSGCGKVLMGVKDSLQTNEFCFPGGFADPSDQCFEDAIVRETKEEVNMDINKENLDYVCTLRGKDWRYPLDIEGITTTLFLYYYGGEAYNIVDEFNKLEWIELNTNEIKRIHPVHRKLFEKLLERVR